MRDFVEFAVISFAVVAVVIGGFIVLPAHLLMSYTCSNYQKVTGKETRYMTLDTCYIKTEHGWQRYDEYVSRAAASEGLKK